MLGTLLATLVSAGAVLVTAKEYTRVRRLGPSDPKGFVKEVRSGSDAVAEAALRRTFPDVDSLFDGLVSGASPSPRAVATVNEQLSDVERELRAGVEIARSSVRMALFSATLGGVIELVASLSAGAAVGLSDAGAAFLTGCTGAAACFEMGRRRAAYAEKIRGEWDSIAQALAVRLSGSPKAVSPGKPP